MRKEREHELRKPDENEPITFSHAFDLSMDSRPSFLKSLDKEDTLKNKREKYAFYTRIRLKAEGMAGYIDQADDVSENEFARMTYKEWSQIFAEAVMPQAGVEVEVKLPEEVPDLAKQLKEKKTNDLVKDFFKKVGE